MLYMHLFIFDFVAISANSLLTAVSPKSKEMLDLDARLSRLQKFLAENDIKYWKTLASKQLGHYV